MVRFLLSRLDIISSALLTFYFHAVMEITGERWRTLVGINIQAMFAVGYISLSGFAYAFRNWRHLQFAISFVPVPFFIFWLFLPESPRYLFKSKQTLAK